MIKIITSQETQKAKELQQSLFSLFLQNTRSWSKFCGDISR